MVSPVNSSGITTLQRASTVSSPNQAANRQVAQTVLNTTPQNTKTGGSNSITLASASPQPSSNLPRGSIVDKLV